MSTTDNAMTLEVIMSRLSALEQENKQLRGEMAALRTGGGQPNSSLALMPQVQAIERIDHSIANNDVRTSRRVLLRRAAGAAVATVAAGALVQQEGRTARAAAHEFGYTKFFARCDDPDCFTVIGEISGVVKIYGNASNNGVYSEARGGQNAVYANGLSGGTGVHADSDSGVAVYAHSGSGSAAAVEAASDSANAVYASTNSSGGAVGRSAIEVSNRGSGPAVRATGSTGDGIQARSGGAALSFPDAAAAVHADGGSGLGVFATNTGSRPAIEGGASNWDGIYGHGALNGVIGRTGARDHSGVFGHNTGGGYGVTGHTESGADRAGVSGRNFGANGPGVLGESANLNGPGLFGKGAIGVVGESHSAESTGVYGDNKSGGYGVIGGTVSNTKTGVYGYNFGTAPAVMGLSQNNNGDGVLGEGKQGVHGKSGTVNANAVWGQASGEARGVAGTSPSGYGGYFQGGKAQLRLVPATTVGKPATGTHSVGELFLDKAATLWICTLAGTPGTWRRVTTTTT